MHSKPCAERKCELETLCTANCISEYAESPALVADTSSFEELVYGAIDKNSLQVRCYRISSQRSLITLLLSSSLLVLLFSLYFTQIMSQYRINSDGSTVAS